MDHRLDVLHQFKMKKVIDDILKKKNIKIKKKDFKLDLFKNELVDSIQFLEFISAIEKKIKIKFSNKEMTSENFFSIDGIIKSVEKKINVNKKRFKKSNKQLKH